MRYADPPFAVNRHGGAGVEDGLDAGPTVVVAVLTYLRPNDLVRCLTGVLAEADSIVAPVRVLVVDNDPAGSGGPVVSQFADARISYVVESAPGISAGRNRALRDSSEADVLIFIDDDEVPSAGWLDRMLRTWLSSGAQAVAGRVVSEFDGPLDAWVKASRMFERPEYRSGSLMHAAATSNLLLDLHAVRRADLWFDEEFGLSGGSDTLFTRSLIRAGGVIVWNAEAVVVDHVPVERITRAWVLARSRRMANSEVRVGLVLADSTSARLAQRVRAVVRGSSRIVLGAARAVVGHVTGSLDHQARGRRVLSRGVGMCTAAMGVVVLEYRRPSNGGRSGASAGPGLTVLTSFPEPRSTTNPYIAMLAAAIDAVPEVTLHRFSWRRALLGKHQVFHVHWPETLLGSGRGFKQVVRLLMFAVLVARLRLRRTAVVRTVHNLRPHETRNGVAARLLSALDGLTTLRISLNESTLNDDSGPIVSIVHGHYRDWFANVSVPERTPGQMVMPGLIRRYKDPVGLLDAFKDLGDSTDHHRLRLVGLVDDQELAAEVRTAASRDERVSLVAEYVSDERLAAEIGRAELVILPYREMFNSGSLLLALSLDRPVLVPDNLSNRALADEVGAGWVQLYDGTLTADGLAAALDAVRSADLTVGPDLSRRNWDVVGRAHRDAYCSAAARTHSVARVPR